VEGWKDTLLAFEKNLAPLTGFPVRKERESANADLHISVVFTSVASTLAALRRAGTMAENLSARITLLVPQVVPFPLPLQSPPVLLDWNERRFRVIANETPVVTTVQIYLCRDRVEALRTVLRPHSIVVVGGRRRWWPTAESRLARYLRQQGHEVIFSATE